MTRSNWMGVLILGIQIVLVAPATAQEITLDGHRMEAFGSFPDCKDVIQAAEARDVVAVFPGRNHAMPRRREFDRSLTGPLPDSKRDHVEADGQYLDGGTLVRRWDVSRRVADYVAVSGIKAADKVLSDTVVLYQGTPFQTACWAEVVSVSLKELSDEEELAWIVYGTSQSALTVTGDQYLLVSMDGKTWGWTEARNLRVGDDPSVANAKIFNSMVDPERVAIRVTSYWRFRDPDDRDFVERMLGKRRTTRKHLIANLDLEALGAFYAGEPQNEVLVSSPRSNSELWESF